MEIIDDLLKAENDAAKILEDSKLEALQIRMKVDSDVNQKIKEEKLMLQKRNQENLLKEKEKLEKKYHSIIQEIEMKNQEFKINNKEKIDSVINKIIDFIIKPFFLN